MKNAGFPTLVIKCCFSLELWYFSVSVENRLFTNNFENLERMLEALCKDSRVLNRKIRRIFSKFLRLFLNKMFNFGYIFWSSPSKVWGGYDLTMDGWMGWDGWDVKILGPFGKFLTCCDAVASAGMRRILHNK